MPLAFSPAPGSRNSSVGYPATCARPAALVCLETLSCTLGVARRAIPKSRAVLTRRWLRVIHNNRASSLES
jgi:hypothetical protein